MNPENLEHVSARTYSDAHGSRMKKARSASIKFAPNTHAGWWRKEKEHLTTSALYAYSNELAINWY